MLVKTIYGPYEMMDEFRSFGRDYYSIEGYQAILDYFDEFNEPVEMDVIGICCDFTEADPEDIANDYSITFDGRTWSEAIESGEDYDELFEALLNDLNWNTWAVDLGNGNILYQNY